MKNPQEIYQRIVGLEEQAAAIYLHMASHFSAESAELRWFWLEMGMQEKQHAGLLQFCIAEKLFTTNLPQDNEVQSIAALFEQLSKRASMPDLTIADAFHIAIQMETSEANAIYDRLTASLHTSPYLLRKKIASMLPDHVEHLLKEARKYQVPEETLKELQKVASKPPGE
jgi:rubrerythrin